MYSHPKYLRFGRQTIIFHIFRSSIGRIDHIMHVYTYIAMHITRANFKQQSSKPPRARACDKRGHFHVIFCVLSEHCSYTYTRRRRSYLATSKLTLSSRYIEERVIPFWMVCRAAEKNVKDAQSLDTSVRRGRLTKRIALSSSTIFIPIFNLTADIQHSAENVI